MSLQDVDEPVEIVPADPRWERAFAEEVGRIGAVLAGAPTEHIGSTAVPGLAAKPIVDVMVGVRTLSDSQELVDRLCALGYEDCGGAPGRRYLRVRSGRACNLQVVERDGPLWEENVLLRDYLRANPGAARRTKQPNGQRPNVRRSCSRTRTRSALPSRSSLPRRAKVPSDRGYTSPRCVPA